MNTESLLNSSGLIANIIGTLLIAFAFGKIPEGFGGSTTTDSGKEYHFSYLIHLKQFKWGVGILIFGFIIQLINVLC